MIPPVRNFSWRLNTTQLFGVSKDVYLPRFNIPGHNGIDIIVPPNSYGQDVLAAHDGQVTVVFKDDPTRKNGNGIYLQGYDGQYYVDTNYWHLSEILVQSGQSVKAGDVIGKIGNTGFVIPPPSLQCPKCGSHLHFGVRKIKIKVPGSDTQIIPTDYNGFCDPVPLLFKEGDKLPIYFRRDLFLGCSGDDVSWLQTCLKIEGLANDYEPIGFFGNKTRRDVSLLQSRYDINPIFGYVGPKTRALLNSKYSNKYGQ